MKQVKGKDVCVKIGNKINSYCSHGSLAMRTMISCRKKVKIKDHIDSFQYLPNITNLSKRESSVAAKIKKGVEYITLSSSRYNIVKKHDHLKGISILWHRYSPESDMLNLEQDLLAVSQDLRKSISKLK